MSARPTAFAKLGLLSALYFSQGLPFGFFNQGLPVLLRQRGFSLTAIGLSSLLAAPWALKWLWAPLLDRWYWPTWGRRRSWILPLQLATIGILLVLALLGGVAPMSVLLGAVFALNLLAATQDIATDGLAVALLSPGERGVANGIQVAGYRFGMIIGGGALLIWHERLGTAGSFGVMALLTALATLPILLAREPGAKTAPDERVRVRHWLRRPGAPRLLALLVAYKAGDAFATGMLRPFLVDRGLTLADVGWLLGTVGFVSGLLGALAGGALVNRLGRKPALLGFGLLQALTVAGYAWVASLPLDRDWLYWLCGAEHFASGMATAALFTCMMDWCSDEASATDYTVQASGVVIATGAASALAGVSAQQLGYVAHFAAAAALALLALLVVHWSFPSAEQALLLQKPRGATP
jgi:MFS transporter, PAT family, beta-lactamase induction signal transducer AmpG